MGMGTMRRAARWSVGTLAVVCLLVGAGWKDVQAQGPFSAQIQMAIRALTNGSTPVTTIRCTGGLVSAPCYSYTANTNSGMYNGGGGSNAFSTGGLYNGALGFTGQGIWQVSSGGAYAFNSTSAIGGALDVWLRRGAAKVLTIDTDGAGGNLTSINLDGPVFSIDGAQAAPVWTFQSQSTFGFYKRGTSLLTLVQASTGVMDFDGITNTEHLNIKATGIFGFSSGNADTAAADTAISRISAGLLGVGTGASGDFAAAIKATTYISAGSGMAVANVGANSCGTTTATIAGNNNANVTTVGATAGTQCRIAFTLAATTEWSCAANDDTTTVAVRTTPVDTTHTDIIGTFTAGDKVTAICFPR